MLDCLADNQIFAHHAQQVLQADECCVTSTSNVIAIRAMQGAGGHHRLEGKLNALRQSSEEL